MGVNPTNPLLNPEYRKSSKYNNYNEFNEYAVHLYFMLFFPIFFRNTIKSYCKLYY